MKTINEVRELINTEKPRSAWRRGVNAYALDLLENLEEYRKYDGRGDDIDPRELKAELLNGATDWNAYSWGGSSLIYDTDIADRLCTPSELKRTRNGERRPNSHEEWLDTQARALCQAYRHIISLCIYG